MYVARNLNLDEESLEILRRSAEETHLSMSAVVRILVRRLRDGEVKV